MECGKEMQGVERAQGEEMVTSITVKEYNSAKDSKKDSAGQLPLSLPQSPGGC